MVKEQDSKAHELRQQVDALQRETEDSDRGRGAARRETLKIPFIVLGCALYAMGMNLFLKPLRLYAGGFMGAAQLVQVVMIRLGISFAAQYDLTGVIYYLINIPALILAYRRMRRRFFVKTLVAVSATTVLLQIIPTPGQMILEDTLGNLLVAGVICGTGSGIVLRMGASDGGMNLVGMMLISRRHSSTVGRINLIFNAVLYAVYLLLFDAATAIYSLLYSAVHSFACDRIHAQNISVQMLVMTKLKDTSAMEVEVLGEMNRGMTRLKAEGVYTGDEEKIYLVFLSKYEVNRFRAIVHHHDPKAFIAESEGVSISGNFLRKLT